MTMNGPEPDDVIGTEDPRASFEDFVEDAADRLLAAAELLTGPAEAQDLLAGVLERARHRWWWIARPGRDPEPQVLRMLARASGRRDRPAPDELARAAAVKAGGPSEPGIGSAPDELARWAAVKAGGPSEPGIGSAPDDSARLAAAKAGRLPEPGDRPAPDELARWAAVKAGRPPEPSVEPESDWPASVLLATVAEKRARHARRRAVACGVAGVVVLAGAAWPVTSALRGGPPGGAPPHQVITASRSPLISAVSGLGPVPGPSPVGPPVRRAAGTVLRECQDANNGQISRHWRTQSLHAGPVWFVYAKVPGVWSGSRPLPHGRLGGQAGVIAIRAGQRAVVRVTGPARARFRFLPGFDSSDVYTLRGGLPGLTLGGCPSVFTMFWQGYISSVGCVPLVVRPLPHGRPVHITLSASGRPCTTS